MQITYIFLGNNELIGFFPIFNITVGYTVALHSFANDKCHMVNAIQNQKLKSFSVFGFVLFCFRIAGPTICLVYKPTKII